MLNEGSEPNRFRVSRVKTKIQAFNDILDAAVLSVSVSGEDVEVVERFTYLGSDIHVSAGCESEVVWIGPGESWIQWIMGCGAACTCAGGRKSESSGPLCFQSCSVDVRL